MIKKLGVLALVCCLFLLILSPSLVQAQGGLIVLDSSAQVEFPSKLNFSLSAQSEVNITDIRFHYVIDRLSYAQVTSEVYIEFTPATTVEASWDWDMRKTGGLPPGSNLEYWWTVEDAKQDKIETAPIRVQFDDTRYSWRSLTEGEVLNIPAMSLASNPVSTSVKSPPLQDLANTCSPPPVSFI